MDDSQGNRANNKRRRTEAAHDLQLEDVMAQRLRREAKAIEDRRSCICQGALYKGGAYPHQWNCQGCSCTDSFETPMYSDATRRTAVSLEKPEEAVDIMEMEYKQWGKSNAMAHKHLKWGYDASLRGSVKNFILRKEAEVMPRTALVNAIRVKNQEFTAVQHVQAQGPGIAAPRSEEEIRYWWNAPDFSREMYGIDLEHFITIRQSGQHLGLTKYEIHCYLKSGASVSERGTIQLFALKTKVKKLTPAGKAGEIHRLQMELKVLEEVLEKGVVVLW